jgi:hypothetical protein
MHAIGADARQLGSWSTLFGAVQREDHVTAFVRTLSE